MESDFALSNIDKSTLRSSLASVYVEVQFHARLWEELEQLELLAAKSNFVCTLGD